MLWFIFICWWRTLIVLIVMLLLLRLRDCRRRIGERSHVVLGCIIPCSPNRQSQAAYTSAHRGEAYLRTNYASRDEVAACFRVLLSHGINWDLSNQRANSLRTFLHSVKQNKLLKQLGLEIAPNILRIEARTLTEEMVIEPWMCSKSKAN